MIEDQTLRWLVPQTDCDRLGLSAIRHQKTSALLLPRSGTQMTEQVHKHKPDAEYFFHERCWILESWNDAKDDAVSIARARVEVGVTTKPHRLEGVVERYLIVQGTGIVTIGDLEPERMNPGDVAVVPSGISQQICNDGPIDLVFYCICTPRFIPACYESLE